MLTDNSGCGLSMVLSDLTEDTVFQKGNDSRNIFHIALQYLKDVRDDATVVIASWQDLLTIFTIHIDMLCLQTVFRQAYLHSQWLLDSRRQTTLRRDTVFAHQRLGCP